jgi:hypothetical protein
MAPARARASPPETRSRWYGWQNLASDGASIALWAGGSAVKLTPVAAVGFGGFYFSSPTVHFIHGNVGRGILSIVLRSAGTLVTYAGAWQAISTDGRDMWLLATGVVVLVSAIPIDAIVGYEDVKPRETSVGWMIAPWLATGTTGLAVAARF